MDKLDHLIRLLKQSRAQSQVEQEKLLKLRLDEVVAEHGKKSHQTALALQDIKKLHGEIVAEIQTLSSMNV